MEGIEGTITSLVLWLKLGAEGVSALLVGVGIVTAVYYLGRTLRSPSHIGYLRTRLTFSRFLVLALEFQLAADILGTAMAPGWDQLGRLGAIAAIRTFLNFFLGREIKEEEQQVSAT